MGDKTRGFYQKFSVTRTDGKSEPGKKHYECEYFVLDLTHDPFAWESVRAYMQACSSEYPLLAEDLRLKIAEHDAGY